MTVRKKHHDATDSNSLSVSLPKNTKKFLRFNTEDAEFVVDFQHPGNDTPWITITRVDSSEGFSASPVIEGSWGQGPRTS